MISVAVIVPCHNEAGYVTTDADVELAPGWADVRADTLARGQAAESIGAVNGSEDQSHLFCRFPNAASVSAASGPYRQPTAPGPGGRAAMVDWMQRWPSPSFAESRNGFIFGRLERFASVFTETVLTELELGQ